MDGTDIRMTTSWNPGSNKEIHLIFLEHCHMQITMYEGQRSQKIVKDNEDERIGLNESMYNINNISFQKLRGNW